MHFTHHFLSFLVTPISIRMWWVRIPMSFWFAFLLWLTMLNIFSCIYLPLLLHLRNIHSIHLQIYWLNYLLFVFLVIIFELFIYCGYQPLIRWIHSKDFLACCGMYCLFFCEETSLFKPFLLIPELLIFYSEMHYLFLYCQTAFLCFFSEGFKF
jgi:hypothetical protein